MSIFYKVIRIEIISILGFLILINPIFAYDPDYSEVDVIYEVKSGDTLWSIAQEHYGLNNGNLWRRIYSANDLSIYRGFPLIHASNKIIIPTHENLDKKPILKNDEGNPQRINLPNRINFYSDILEDDNQSVSPRHNRYLGVYGYDKNFSSFCNPNNLPKTRKFNKFYLEDDNHTSECSVSADSEGFSYRMLVKKDDQEYMYAVQDGIKGQRYDFLNQITYHPTENKIVYRARIDDSWYVVYDNKKSHSFDYIEGVFFTSDGSLYVWAKEEGTHSIEKIYIDDSFNKKIASADYLDHIMQIDQGKKLAYRQKNDLKGGELWNYVLEGKELTKWDYVDLPYYHPMTGSFFYRARNDQGAWLLIKADDQGREETIFTYEGKDELTNYFVNPLNSEQVFITQGRARAITGYSNSGIPIARSGYEYTQDGLIKRCLTIENVIFSSDSKHHAYYCSGENKLIVDDVTFFDKSQFAKFDVASDNLPPLPKFGFDHENNFVIYNTEFKDVYRLD